MAGFVVNNGMDDRIQFVFHIDTPNLAANIRQASTHKRVITLQLDGDELEAALWGLEHYTKGRIVVPADVFDGDPTPIQVPEQAFRGGNTVIITKE